MVGVLSVGILGTVVGGMILTGNWPFGGDHGPVGGTGDTTITAGHGAPSAIGEVVLDALALAQADPDLDWLDPSWNPEDGLLVQVDEQTTVGFQAGMVTVVVDQNGDGLGTPMTPVAVMGHLQSAEGGSVFVPTPGLSAAQLGWIDDHLAEIPGAVPEDGQWQLPPGSAPILPAHAASDWEAWLQTAAATVAADPGSGGAFLELPVPGGGWQAWFDGTVVLQQHLSGDFSYVLPGADHAWVIDEESAALLIPSASGSLEVVGWFDWQLPRSGVIEAVFDWVPEARSGSLFVPSTQVLDRLPGIEQVAGSGAGERDYQLLITYAAGRSPAEQAYQPSWGWDCAPQAGDSGGHYSCSTGQSVGDATRPAPSGGGSVVCDVGATLLDVGTLGISWAIEQTTGYGGADVCEGVGDVVDGAVAGGSELVDLGASGLHAGWDYGSAGVERVSGAATDLADETIDWVLTGLTGEWKCPIVRSGEASFSTTWSSGPGLAPASTGSTAYDAAVAANGSQDLDVLARAWFPGVEYAANEPCGRILRILARVHTYGADGTVIVPPSLDAAQWVEIVYTVFFEVDAGRFGVAGHAGDNEGFVVALERGPGCGDTGFVFVNAESWGHKKSWPIEPSHDSLSAAEAGACPLGTPGWRILVSEGKHAVYFHEDYCEEELELAEECGGGEVYDLRSHVQLIMDQGVTCADGLASVEGALSATVWPPADWTYGFSEENLLPLETAAALGAVTGGAVGAVGAALAVIAQPVPDIIWDPENRSFHCGARGGSVCAALAAGQEPDLKYHSGVLFSHWSALSCPATLTVPDLSRMLRRDAEAVLRAAGFSECTTTVCRGDQWVYAGLTGADDPAELGKVADQYPKPGTAVPVTLKVPGVRFWLGTQLVPDVLGLSGAEAAAEIQRWNLRPSQIGTEATSDPALDGKVVRQSPPAGGMVSSGTRISYWIGEAGGTGTSSGTTSGTSAPTTIVLKNYSGWSCSAARADLQALGLVAPACGFSWYVPYDSPLVGQVDSQEPAAGTTVARGSTVLLWALEAATTESTCAQAGGYWYMKSIPCPGGGGECAQLACWMNPGP